MKNTLLLENTLCILIFAPHPWPTPYFQTFLQHCYGARGWLSTAVNLVKICKRLWWLLHSCINLSKLCKTTTQWNLNFRRKNKKESSFLRKTYSAKTFQQSWSLFQEGKWPSLRNLEILQTKNFVLLWEIILSFFFCFLFRRITDFFFTWHSKISDTVTHKQ